MLLMCDARQTANLAGQQFAARLVDVLRKGDNYRYLEIVVN